MMRLLVLVAFAGLSEPSLLPEVTSYVKVSRNGEEQKDAGGLIPWITRALTRSNATARTDDRGRSVQDIVLTMSPIYVTPRTPVLQKGEAIDYTTRRYSTLNHDLIASLGGMKPKKVDRYHPGPLTIDNGQSLNNKPKTSGKRPSGTDLVPASGMDSYDFSKPPFVGSFDYKPVDLSDKPISKPISMDDYPGDMMTDAKQPQDSGDDTDTEDQGHDQSPHHDHDHFPDYPPDYPGHHGRPQIIVEPYEYHHGVLYGDHLPNFHDHHHQHTEHKEEMTEMPEMNDQRLDKRPYSYYYIGKKLWYIPLYFSIYFIIYVAALVLKSIARHKIALPDHLAQVAGHSRMYDDPSWWEYAERVLESAENLAEKFGRVS